MASTEQANIPWKEEVQRRRIQNERTRDVERKWEHLINTEGEGAPEWMRETALKKKAARDKLTAAGIPPWMQEVQRRNTGLTKKMHEARTIGEIDESEQAPQPETSIAVACTKGEEATKSSVDAEEQVTDRGDETEREEPPPHPEPPITADCTKEEEDAETNGYTGEQEDGRGDDEKGKPIPQPEPLRPTECTKEEVAVESKGHTEEPLTSKDDDDEWDESA